MSEKVWLKLQYIEASFGKKIHIKEWKLTGHPSEIIFKYMRLIAISRNEEELEKEYAKKMANCLIYRGATEDVVRKFGEIEVMNKIGDIENRDEISLELCYELADNYPVFADIVIIEDGEARFQWLNEKITFMYR